MIKIWNKLLDWFVPDSPKIKSKSEYEKYTEVYSAYLEGWVTRDKSGKLQLHCRKPARFKIFGEWSKGLANIPPNHFPNLKWEHEALKVIVILRSGEENKTEEGN